MLDIGSGAGHWIDFYRSCHVKTILGIDISENIINFLKKKYEEYLKRSVFLTNGKAHFILDHLGQDYDIVNAIGVMFHIVNDKEWEETVLKVGNVVKENGVFIIGGHFGFFNKINVQHNNQGVYNKRIRSYAAWKKILKKAGFTKIQLYKNDQYLHINQSLPENNVIVATKQSVIS